MTGKHMLLNRLQCECEQYILTENPNEKRLWARSVNSQIARMKDLYLWLEPKPSGLSLELIADYEYKMKNPQ